MLLLCGRNRRAEMRPSAGRRVMLWWGSEHGEAGCHCRDIHYGALDQLRYPSPRAQRSAPAAGAPAAGNRTHAMFQSWATEYRLVAPSPVRRARYAPGA